MKIYWRVCEAQQTLSFVPRWQNKDKVEIIKKCWMSLQHAIAEDDEIIVVEDKCSEDTLKYLDEHSKSKIFIHHVPQETGPVHELLNGKSIHFVEVAKLLDESTKLLPETVHFMCNDDFLFLPNAILEMKTVFETGWDGFVLPYDYPDRYTLDKTRLCEVYAGVYRHWRTVPSCTSITSARGRIWQQYMRSFKRNAYFNDDSWTWEAYNFAKTKALCPIPGLATHLTEGCMTPYVNWEQVWDKIEV